MRVRLRTLLDQVADIKVVGETGDGEETLQHLDLLQPDVAVLDCQLPGMGGVEVSQEIVRRGLPLRVLALSAYDKEEYMRGMLAVGAVGYVLKDKPPETILAAVRAAAQRTRLWTTEQVARALRWQEEVQERWEHLTEREREVLLLVVAGRSNREITREMGISEKTVEYHVTDIWGKLNVDSRSKAIAWLKDSGLGFGTSEPREIPR